MQTLIVIPARYSSSRFPGKPLAQLAGKTILERVWEIASFVCERVENCRAVVATETPSSQCPSDRIIDFCKQRGIPVVETSNECRSGTDRAWETVCKQSEKPDVIVNLQGDVPTCPPNFLMQIIDALQKRPEAAVASIYARLSWRALDALRNAKKTNPFSGTTVAVDKQGRALWFSKNIIPAVRKENDLRKLSNLSPILRHVGLYAYRSAALEFFANSPKGYYEKLEELEQLRFLENGYLVQMVEGSYPPGYDQVTSGVDSPEDLERVESIIRSSGELLDYFYSQR